MGFFDNTEEGFNRSADILERVQAGLTNRLPQYEEAQQQMKLRQFQAFQKINEELRTIALEDPATAGPMLKQLQTISKSLGVPIPDEVLKHYTDNPLSLGMSFHEELFADASPMEKRQLALLSAQSLQPGPRQKDALDRLDSIRTVKLAQIIDKNIQALQAKHLAETGEPLGRVEAYITVMDELPPYARNHKMLRAAMDVVEKRPGLNLAMKEKEAEIKNKFERSRMSGDQLFVEAATKKFPDDPQKQAEEVRRLRNNPESTVNILGNYLIEKNMSGKSDPRMDQSIKDVQAFMAGTQASKSAGAESGRLNVRSSEPFQATEENIAERRARGTTAGRPLEAGTQKDIAALESIERQIANVDTNKNNEFLGPVKGTETAFGARRQIGSYLKTPLGERETIFRQALADISDQLLRARSGAQINETEYQRLKNMLPKATDEPQVFDAGMKRFRNEIADMKKSKVRLGITPRGGITAPGKSSGKYSTEQIEKDKKLLGIE